MSGRLRGLVLAAGLAATAAGCTANHASHADREDPPTQAGSDGATVLATDTVRGTVAIAGADPLTRVVLRVADGRATEVRGPLADTLRNALGLDVMVAGVVGGAAGDGIEAAGFRIRGLDGLVAADGRLELDGDAVVLVTVDGARLRYPAAPEALRQLAGRRVWIAGMAGAEPQHWGPLDR